MRIHIDDSSFLSDLTQFLRRCECRVEQVSAKTLRVELSDTVGEENAIRRVRQGFCASCGEPIERVLLNLGSTTCHDCRNALHMRDWARMEISAFLRVWQLRNPEARAELLP
jgi:hypothetical protein